ncbi:hypothetical protein [Phaeovulum vinaykumarii]|uniref:Uncharacterized protein n=1 Tax=Phaeovulum vinaykumarii TaxID=407234 RepID=A0A1N7MEI9_9RHOB|nr:hypothetical protein [Phaeovulum vinaykumarii]SIS84411.1 hypothetical protein SAMN05421795_10713 [Phaeovulum vinaykumarii]SOC11757.1 hypothetical protein SAMN05878426_10713 [Phaeovulum vinaykumarii]
MKHALPLPHFLVLVVAVILAAALTLWAAFRAGISLMAVGLLALAGAGVVRLMTRVE